MIAIQGQYAATRVMIDEIDADTRRRIYHILAAPVSEGSRSAVDLHEVLPEIYNLKGR